jgi:CubicO group peptidase (beta-lactamase class C family)
VNERIPRTRAALEAGVASGREPGLQLHASLAGETVAELALGEAQPGVPMTTDHLVLWISSTKPVMGVAYGQLIERGRVGLDDPVDKHLPEFAAAGKQGITLRHLLTHTAGFRAAWREWLAPPFHEVVRIICEAPQEAGWEPGRSCGYNVVAAWYVLAAVLERVDGRDYGSYARAEIFGPLGMSDCWIGMPPETFRAYGDRVARMPFLEQGEWKLDPAWGTEEGCAVLRPGGNGYGPMRQLVRLFQMLLGRGQLDGTRVLQPETVALLCERHTRGLRDQTFQGVYDRGLGVVIDSKQYPDGCRWYGPHATERAFGHQGFFASVVFCDPTHDLAVALAFHGVRPDPQHDARVEEALGALYVDLGLVAT